MKCRWKTAFALLLPVFLEFFIFNFSAVSGKIQGQAECTTFQMTVSESMYPLYDGGYMCMNEERTWIELTDIDQEIHTMYLDADVSAKKFVTVNIYGIDKGSSKYYLMGSQNIVPDAEESKWIDLHFYEKAKSIRLEFQVMHNAVLHVNSICLNKEKPLFIHWERPLLLYVLGFFVYVLKRNSNPKAVWNISFEEGEKKYAFVAGLCMLILAAAVGVLVQLNTATDEIHQNLAEAFMEGRTYVDEEPPQYLTEMENPYDFHAREELQAETEELYLWDYAYYDGHYYVYFGVLPVLLLYLPVYALTGVMLRTDIVLGLFCLLLIPACFYLVYAIFRRWFKQCPYILYPIFAVSLFFGSGIITLLRRPAVYEVCIISGMVCVIAGLAFWIVAGTEGKLCMWKLFVGSLLVAATAACRPHFLIGMLLAIVLFVPVLIEDRKLKIGKHAGEIVAFAVPFVVVAAAVMSYNYVRFDSVFEFGATYNLTTNDVTGRGWNAARTGYGIYEYLLRPLCFQTRFPFLAFQEMDTSYIGLTIYERHFGGIIWYNPLIFLAFGKIAGEKERKEAGILKGLTIASIVCTILIVVANANMGGIVERYQSDFLWVVYLFIMIRLLWKMDSLTNEDARRKYRNRIIVFVLITVLLNFLMLWTDDIYDVYENNIQIFTKLKCMFEFWN